MLNSGKKAYHLFVGIDISKSVFDAAVVNDEGEKLGHRKFKNNSSGFDFFFSWLEEYYQDGSILFCMEHTGVYSRLLSMYIQDKGSDLCMESGFTIKRSGGVIKGKNDKIDAYRIAEYALFHKTKIRLQEPYNESYITLHDLLTTRTRLVTSLKALTTPLGELKDFGGEHNYEIVKAGSQAAIEGLKQSIKDIDKLIDELTDQDTSIKENLDLAISVKGIGKIVALWMIVYTRNFSENTNARKFASLVGIAPFEELSGSSVRRGSHVSNHAHRFLKGILHTSAMAAIKNSKRIKDYHTKKKGEGKKGFVVMNNIKNKLVQTVFAVVRSGKPYEENFMHIKAA